MVKEVKRNNTGNNMKAAISDRITEPDTKAIPMRDPNAKSENINTIEKTKHDKGQEPLKPTNKNQNVNFSYSKKEARSEFSKPAGKNENEKSSNSNKYEKTQEPSKPVGKNENEKSSNLNKYKRNQESSKPERKIENDNLLKSTKENKKCESGALKKSNVENENEQELVDKEESSITQSDASQMLMLGNQPNELENDETSEDSIRLVAFDSLIQAEKDFIMKKVRNQIFCEDEVSDRACIEFYIWLKEQFEKSKTAPPPASLLSSLEHILENIHTPYLFNQSTDEDKVIEYMNNFVDKIEIDLENENLDIFALGEAIKGYIKKYVDFFDDEIIEKVFKCYKNNNNKENLIKRLPFLVKNRSVFREIIRIIKKQEENKSKTKVDLKKSYKIWNDVIFNNKLENGKDLSPQLRSKILEDIVQADFEYLDPSFYD